MILGRGVRKSNQLLELMQGLASRYALITSDRVAILYGQDLLAFLQHSGVQVTLYAIADGEEAKTRETKQRLEDELLRDGYGPDCGMIALGGGVVTDLVGFVASTFCRGVPLILLPTTLLAMVDACIGGKNGVNTPLGKNLVGTIYPPHALCIDLDCFHTLPEIERSNGFVEMAKHGLVASAEHFERICQQLPLLRQGERLAEAIEESCQIKQRIVQQSQQLSALRHLLNFGHTIGHALEVASGYQISHGQAVAFGCLAESRLSHRLGYLSQEALARIEVLFSSLIAHACSAPVAAILSHLQRDKKCLMGRPRFVLLQEIGKVVPFDAEYCTFLDKEMVRSALQETADALCVSR